MKSYILNHWHGELPLYLSYWVTNVLLSVLLSVFLSFVFIGVDQLTEVEVDNIIVGIALLIQGMGIIYLWQTVGLWRCCTRKINEGSRFWARLVQALIVLWLFLISLNVLNAIWTSLSAL